MSNVALKSFCQAFLFIWLLTCGIVTFHGLKLSISGSPFAFVSVILWVLICLAWQAFMVALLRRRDRAPIWASLTIGCIYALLSWPITWLMGLANFTTIGSVPLVLFGIVAGLTTGVAKAFLVKTS